IHLLVSRPPPFKSHVSGVLPVFDAVYGPCIERFISARATTPCEPGDFNPGDFRSVVSSDQLDGVKGVAAAAELAGRSFVVYRLNESIPEVTFPSPATAHIRTPQEKTQTSWSLKDRLLCLQRDCQIIRRWDQRRYLGFDPKSGTISSWWIEK